MADVVLHPKKATRTYGKRANSSMGSAGRRQSPVAPQRQESSSSQSDSDGSDAEVASRLAGNASWKGKGKATSEVVAPASRASERAKPEKPRAGVAARVISIGTSSRRKGNNMEMEPDSEEGVVVRATSRTTGKQTRPPRASRATSARTLDPSPSTSASPSPSKRAQSRQNSPATTRTRTTPRVTSSAHSSPLPIVPSPVETTTAPKIIKGSSPVKKKALPRSASKHGRDEVTPATDMVAPKPTSAPQIKRARTQSPIDNDMPVVPEPVLIISKPGRPFLAPASAISSTLHQNPPTDPPNDASHQQLSHQKIIIQNSMYHNSQSFPPPRAPSPTELAATPTILPSSRSPTKSPAKDLSRVFEMFTSKSGQGTLKFPQVGLKGLGRSGSVVEGMGSRSVAKGSGATRLSFPKISLECIQLTPTSL
ncbi:hypothetical protein P7C70_g7047, partial [Phenoliferia sp. Uapishka_3]